jgi:hypothetical protein
MMYKVCDSCGANLDPGESCDCKRETHEQAEAENVAALLFVPNQAAGSTMSLERRAV